MSSYSLTVQFPSKYSPEEMSAIFEPIFSSGYLAGGFEIQSPDENLLSLTFNRYCSEDAGYVLGRQHSKTISLKSVENAAIAQLKDELKESIEYYGGSKIGEIDQIINSLDGGLFFTKNMPDLMDHIISMRDHELKNNSVTQFMTAVEHGYADAVISLLNEGADINAKNQNGCNSLFLTIDPNMVELLLERGIDANCLDPNKNTPLIWLSSQQLPGHLHVLIDMLIRHGADLEAKNEIGETALFAAAKLSSSKNAIALLNAGADFTVVNRLGESILTSSVTSPESAKVIKAFIESQTLNDSIESQCDRDVCIEF